MYICTYLPTMRSVKRCDIILFSYLAISMEILVTSFPHAIEFFSLNSTNDHNVIKNVRQNGELANDFEKRHPNSTSAMNEFFAVKDPVRISNIYTDHVEVLSDAGKSYQEKNKDAFFTEKYEFPTESSSAEATYMDLISRNKDGNTEEIRTFKSVESDEKVTGTMLDELASSKLNTAEVGNTLPIYLVEPENSYVVKNRPAVLKCKAAHALQLHFKCSGSSQPPPSTHDKHVDPHTGVHLEEVTATIYRDLVDEYFGNGPFKCECHAWSSRGVVKSQAATVSIAYIRKQFLTSPTSLRTEIGSRADLICKPPDGFPEPKITWYKNNVPLSGILNSERSMPSISNVGTLTFSQVSLQDMANYTCSAENIAGKRVSDSAVLIVYVNGGWSVWSSWKDCKCSGQQIQGRKRTRSCNNPMPMNGGLQCLGPQIQKSPDCITCSDAQIIHSDEDDTTPNKRLGKWSVWSEWSLCSSDCIQIRRRRCISNVIDEKKISSSFGNAATNSGAGITSLIAGNNLVLGKLQCFGKDIQTAECRGEQCHIGKDDFDWTFYLGVAFISTVCFAFGIALICCARRDIAANPQYNAARTVMDTEYMQGINKKDIRMHIGAVNVSYDYAHPNQRYFPSASSEHHYDVPNISANYTNPIDDASVQFLTDTPDTSTEETCNSTYDATSKFSTIAVSKSNACESINSHGGNLRLYNKEIVLYIPELAIGKGVKKMVSLMLLSDDTTRMPSAESLIVCSSTIHCTPRNFNFLKPVILKVPHCLVNPDLWHVNIFHADSEQDDLNVSWRKIISIGDETINTPVFVQLEEAHVYIMTEQLGRFVVVAQPKLSVNFVQPSIKMKLIAFSQVAPNASHYSLRIYVVKNFPNSNDICSGIESQLGGSYMGVSQVFIFHLNNCSLNIRVRVSNVDSQDVEQHEHVIPYNHILNNNSILHCEFAIRKLIEQQTNHLALDVDFAQSGDSQLYTDWYNFTIPNTENAPTFVPDLETTVTIDRQGKFVNDNSVVDFVQLPRLTKRLICAALDPPRSDERDWRQLAKKLKSDRYIAYFATKPSPTEQILNLWECRASNSTYTAIDLIMAFKDMERNDVMDIITETIGPLWI